MQQWIPALLAALVLGGLGALFGGILTAADKKFAVQSDERWAKITEELGGANCGACGYSGCGAYADAILAGKAPITKCPSANVEAIAAIMGVEAELTGPRKAYVRCQSTNDNTRSRYIYDGYHSCATAAGMAGGPKLCCYGCIGLGDCEKVCPFNAISIKNGLATVDEARCIGCGLCAEYCPRHVIAMKPQGARVHVKCNNGTLARTARISCIKSCIGCGACVKKCPQQAIRLEDGHAVIDYEKCTGCMACLNICPSWCIVTEENWR